MHIWPSPTRAVTALYGTAWNSLSAKTSVLSSTLDAAVWAADRKQTTILEFDKPHRNGEHPTMKPVALFEYQMLNNTKGGDMVLDLFGGSGTTLLAAEKHGRHAYLMELDPKYCDVIVKRWEDFTGKTAQLLTETAEDA